MTPSSPRSIPSRKRGGSSAPPFLGRRPPNAVVGLLRPYTKSVVVNLRDHKVGAAFTIPKKHSDVGRKRQARRGRPTCNLMNTGENGVLKPAMVENGAVPRADVVRERAGLLGDRAALPRHATCVELEPPDEYTSG